MTDTNPQAEKKMAELMGQKSAEERLIMGCSMFMFAKTLVTASLEQKAPLNEKILRQQLFLRFYGNEFDEEQKKKILEHLSSATGKSQKNHSY